MDGHLIRLVPFDQFAEVGLLHFHYKNKPGASGKHNKIVHCYNPFAVVVNQILVLNNIYVTDHEIHFFRIESHTF